jgi:hypothetical protein
MVLVQTLERPVHGYWDGGAKQVFHWTIENSSAVKGRDFDPPLRHKNRWYVKIGSWSANTWFYVLKGKTAKLTLANARRHLQAVSRVSIKSFEYIEEKKCLQ